MHVRIHTHTHTHTRMQSPLPVPGLGVLQRVVAGRRLPASLQLPEGEAVRVRHQHLPPGSLHVCTLRYACTCAMLHDCQKKCCKHVCQPKA